MGSRPLASLVQEPREVFVCLHTPERVENLAPLEFWKATYWSTVSRNAARSTRLPPALSICSAKHTQACQPAWHCFECLYEPARHC